MDRPRDALASYERAFEDEAPKPGELSTMGGYLRALGRRRAAESAVHQALSMDPHDPQALGAMAGLLGEKDRTRAASLALSHAAVDAAPHDADLRALHASTLIATGHHERADLELQRAHREEPRNPAAQRVRAELDL